MGWFSRGQKVTEYGSQKARRKHGIAYWVASLFTGAIEMLLGINVSFMVSQSVGIVADNILAGTFLSILAPLITLVVSLAVGAAFFLGGMWIFAGLMDSLADAKAYCEHYGIRFWWPVLLVVLSALAVMVLDYTTLQFRAAYFSAKGADALIAAFRVLIVMPLLIGPLIHVLEHTPRDRRLTKARQRAEQLETDDIESVVQTMDPDLRSRWLDGDADALDEHYQRIDAQRAANRHYEEERMAERDAKERARQSTQQEANKPLPTKRRRGLFSLPSQNQEAS